MSKMRCARGRVRRCCRASHSDPIRALDHVEDAPRLTTGPGAAHRREVRTWLATLGCVLLFGCAADPSDLDPAEALSAFLAALERSTHAPDQRRLAYEWLDLDSQRVLNERAKLSSSLAGRPFEAWDMLVPGRVAFATQSIAGVRLSASVHGEHATVAVPGEGTIGAKVPMVREGGRWRVVLGLTK